MIFDDKMTRIKICLRPNPRMFTDLRHAIETSFNVGLSPDANSFSDLERFESILFHQRSRRLTSAKMSRQIQLKKRIRFYLAPAVNCRNSPKDAL
jgi:hypothetical protein